MYLCNNGTALTRARRPQKKVTLMCNELAVENEPLHWEEKAKKIGKGRIIATGKAQMEADDVGH